MEAFANYEDSIFGWSRPLHVGEKS
jgi:hypothetical protein